MLCFEYVKSPLIWRSYIILMLPQGPHPRSLLFVAKVNNKQSINTGRPRAPAGCFTLPSPLLLTLCSLNHWADNERSLPSICWHHQTSHKRDCCHGSKPSHSLVIWKLGWGNECEGELGIDLVLGARTPNKPLGAGVIRVYSICLQF